MCRIPTANKRTITINGKKGAEGMDEKNVVENFGVSMINLLQMALGSTFEKMENLLLTIQNKQTESKENMFTLIGALGTDFNSRLEIAISKINKVHGQMKQKHEDLEQSLGVMNDNITVTYKTLESLVQTVEQIKQDNLRLKQENANLRQIENKMLESLVQSVEQIKQDNLRLKQENSNLRQIEKNLSEHQQDDTRHIKRINGATSQNLARASEVNQQRGHENNSKVFGAIFGYLQQAQNKSRVDMTWVIQVTKLSETTIRQVIRDYKEAEPNMRKHIRKNEQGVWMIYGMVVPQAFFDWVIQDKPTFFNVPR